MELEWFLFISDDGRYHTLRLAYQLALERGGGGGGGWRGGGGRERERGVEGEGERECPLFEVPLHTHHINTVFSMGKGDHVTFSQSDPVH